MTGKQKAFMAFTTLLSFYAIYFVYNQENPREIISIKTQDNIVYINAEVPRNKKQLNQGLMYRKKLDQDDGMLFDFKTPQKISMWMKNTYIPLDMIFVDNSGNITGLHKNAKPLDESLIGCPPDTRAVLEVNAGSIERWKIAIGDKLQSSIFVVSSQ